MPFIQQSRPGRPPLRLHRIAQCLRRDDRRRSGHIGGVERQTSMLAKWLVSRGYEVSMLTWDEGGPAEDASRSPRHKNLPQRRRPSARPLLPPKMDRLISAMNRANADIYYHNCCEAETAKSPSGANPTAKNLSSPPRAIPIASATSPSWKLRWSACFTVAA